MVHELKAFSERGNPTTWLIVSHKAEGSTSRIWDDRCAEPKDAREDGALSQCLAIMSNTDHIFRLGIP